MTRLGMDAIVKIEQLTMLAEKVGVVVSSDKSNPYTSFTDNVCLYVPKEEGSLPVYRRDTALFRGDVEDCIAWMKGYLAHKEYMRHLGFSDRMMEEAEAKCRQDQEDERLLTAIKTGKDPGIRHQGVRPKMPDDDVPF